MNIIVVSGAYKGIGKTTLIRSIQNALSLERVRIIKFGHHEPKPHKNILLFQDLFSGLNYIEEILKQNVYEFIIVESNQVYKYIYFDLGIYLFNTEKLEKPSGLVARSHADIIIDRNFNLNEAKKLIIKKFGKDLFSQALLEQYNYMFKNTHYCDINIPVCW